MFNNVIDYTISSFDPKHYNRIDINLPPPFSRKAKMIVTSLTTKCSIVVIEPDDYIKINNKKYYFNKQYTDINSTTFSMLLNSILDGSNVISTIDESGRIVLSSKNQFSIDASYNIIQMLGVYNQILPIIGVYNSDEDIYEIIAESIGNTLSTPILYLVSNVGKSSFRNLNDEMNLTKIILRINNSFSANYPIIVTNADFEIEINSCDLSNVQLTLVDANIHEIHLLNPMYITIAIEAIFEEDESVDIVYPVSQNQTQSQK